MNTTQRMTTEFLLSLLFLFFLSRPIPTAGSPFTDKVQRTKDAINVCLTDAHADLDFVTSIPPQPDRRNISARESCVKLFEDSVESFRTALAFMDQLGTPGTPTFHQKIKDASLQLSAGYTYARTCQESFEVVNDGPVKTEVSNRVEDLIKLAGIAIELLNKVEEGTIL